MIAQCGVLVNSVRAQLLFENLMVPLCPDVPVRLFPALQLRVSAPFYIRDMAVNSSKCVGEMSAG